jgi:hypothetical protein
MNVQAFLNELHGNAALIQPVDNATQVIEGAAQANQVSGRQRKSLPWKTKGISVGFCRFCRIG